MSKYSNLKKGCRWPLIILSGLVAVVVSGCAGGSSASGDSADSRPQDNPQDRKPAEGQVNGNAWSFKQGRAVYRERSSYSYYEIRLWDQVFENPCEVVRGSGRQVRMHIEPTLGSWKLEDFGPFAVYPVLIFSDYFQTVKPADNLVADRGTIEIKSIDKTTISGFARGSFQLPTGGALSLVEGQFSVTICPNLSAKRPESLEITELE